MLTHTDVIQTYCSKHFSIMLLYIHNVFHLTHVSVESFAE